MLIEAVIKQINKLFSSSCLEFERTQLSTPNVFEHFGLLSSMTNVTKPETTILLKRIRNENCLLTTGRKNPDSSFSER